MTARARLVGINHAALEVGDLDAALTTSGMGLKDLEKRPEALRELSEKGLG